MAKLWLTYAWKDNAEQDVDHVIHQLERAGLTVSYDRAELLAGQRLWQQIDAAMNDVSVDAWAMFVTEASLRSEACQEEIAYALDRALRSGRERFPLIGIFSQPVDRSLIPSAIAARVYVNLTAPDWQQQIVEAVTQSKAASETPPPATFGCKIHDFGQNKVVEVWPRSGRWFPFVAAVPLAEGDKLQNVLCGPRGGVTGTGIISTSGKQQNQAMQYEVIQHAIDANNSAHVFLTSLPLTLEVGQPNAETYQLDFTNYRGGCGDQTLVAK